MCVVCVVCDWARLHSLCFSEIQFQTKDQPPNTESKKLHEPSTQPSTQQSKAKQRGYGKQEGSEAEKTKGQGKKTKHQKKKKKKEKPKTLTQQKKEKQKPVKSADAWEGSTVIPEGRRCGLGVVARARRYSEQVPRDRIPTSPKWRPSPNECRTKQPTLNVFAVFQDQKTSSSKQHKLSFVETNRPEKGGASFT